jgi:hypothetical protein
MTREQFTPTHRGIVAVAQPGVTPPLRMICPLRETKMHYVTRHGIRYRKSDGSPVNADRSQRHSLDRLDLSTVEAIP